MRREAANGALLLGVRGKLAVLVVLALGTLPFFPNLDLGFYRDDYLHMAELSGEGALPKTGKLSLFRFAEPMSDRMGPVQGDYWPWWQSSENSIDLFRPLSCLSYVAQYALAGADAHAFLLGNLVLWALVLVLVLCLYAELAEASGGGLLTVFLAGVVFAIDRAHEENVGWLGGRYTLVGILFCVPALLAYHRWRAGGARAHAAWMLAWLVLAMLSSEMPVGLAGWFLAYELSLGRGSLAARVRALALPALAIGAYVVFYGAAGYGVVDSAWYLDPFREPRAFLEDGLAQRWPRLLTALLSSEWVALEVRLAARQGGPPGALLLVPFATAAVVLVGLLVRSVRDRATRFAVLGAVIGLVPLATSPSPPRQRVLLLATLGSAYAIGAAVAGALRLVRDRLRGAPDTRPSLRRVVPAALFAVLVVFLHVVFEPELTRQALLERQVSAETERRFALEAELPPDDASADARVLLLNTPLDGVVATFLPIVREAHGHPWPGGAWPISVCPEPHVLTRTGERTFELEVVGNRPGVGFLAPGWVGVVREDTVPVEGDVFRQGALEVTARRVDDGQLKRIAVSIDRALDDTDVWLLAWNKTERRWRRIAAPAIGESITLEPTRP
jgi:hypothetical protein